MLPVKTKRILICLLICLITGIFTSSLYADLVGYYDAEHTKDDSYQSTRFEGIDSNNRYIYGYSKRYDGATQRGITGWGYDTSTFSQVQVGYYDAEHTKDDGYKNIMFVGVTSSGYINFLSERYNGGAALLGYTSGLYDIKNKRQIKLGYYDTEHTKSNGWQLSSMHAVVGMGYVRGTSERYNGGASGLGQTAWAYNAVKDTQYKIGLYDAEHTKDNGYKYSKTNGINGNGYVVGSSKRFNGGATDLGLTAWVFDSVNGSQKELGYYDAEHTKDNGYQKSEARNPYITESGYVGGYSARYNGGAASLGYTTWAYDIANNVQSKVGFYDAEHTRDNGMQYSSIDWFSEAGYVYGNSYRYLGGNVALGQTAWVYDIPNTTQHEVGLYDAEHTSDIGYQKSSATVVTESGYLGGWSLRYNGGAALLGYTRWVYDIPNTTQYEVGLYDAEHTNHTGYQQSYIDKITESGYCTGSSIRYNGGAADLGRTAWVYDIPNTTHHEVGLYDAEHTKDTGYQKSEIRVVTESGYLGGYSLRYAGAASTGKTSWVYDIPNSTQHEVGLYDAEHTTDSGIQSSQVDAITESGYVSGYSLRYNGTAANLGMTSWIYDIPHTTLHEVGIYDAEHTRNDGCQDTSIDIITETGYATGYSNRYKGTNAYLGRTSWLYHVPTSRFAVFDFGEDIVTGEGSSLVTILRDNGTAYGVFKHIGIDGRFDGERLFRGYIDGRKYDLFEEVGGDILNYHFAGADIIETADMDQVVFGLGTLSTDYHPTASELVFALVKENPVVEKAKTKNQKAMASAFGKGSYVGPYATLYQYMLSHTSGDDASDVLQQMIPQADSYARTVGRTGIRLVMDTITNNNFATLGSIGSGLGAGTSSAQAKLNQATSGISMEDATLYGKYIYSKGSQDGDADHNGYEFDSNGIAFGADFARGDSGILGVAIGFLETDIDGENNTGDIDQTSFSPNVYLGISRGKWILNAGLGYGFQQNDSERFSGISEVDKVKSEWDSHSYSVFSSAAYNLKKTKSYSLDVVAGIDYMLLHEEAYTEQSGDTWNMQIDSNTSDTFRSKFGVSIKNNHIFKNGLKLHSEIRSLWIHDYLNEAATAVNSFNGSNSFTIEGMDLDRDRLQLGFSLDFLFTDKTSVFLRYYTEISENADRHEINTGLTYNF